MNDDYKPPERVQLTRYELAHTSITLTRDDIYEYIRADMVEKMIKDAIKDEMYRMEGRAA